jgi:hypothetical protein
MVKINKAGARTAKPSALSPVTTVAKDLKTFEGAAAYSRDAKSDLFLLATTSFFGEDTFYEKANTRNDRFIGLVHRVAKEDPDWILQFLPWLRGVANIRTASVVAAVEAARIMAQADQPGMEVGPARRLLAETLWRADEPAEALAYHLTVYGKKIPNPVRRGIADAARRLYTERNFIKWDSDRAAVRMADVIELTHPKPVDKSKFDHPNRRQSDLFKYIVDSRHRPTPVPDGLNMLKSREMLLADPNKLDFFTNIHDDPERVAGILRSAGMTWEQVSSWGAFTGKTWEGLIPTMGYMALLRNLRNFQDKGVSDKVLKQVAMRIGTEAEVLQSRQLPYRFLSAHLEATHPIWALALESALQYSTANIPALGGRTLVLVDTSGSMTSGGLSAKSKITPMMAGALFGVALASKGEDVDFYGFANSAFQHPVRRGAGILRTVEAFCRRSGETGHGTEIAGSLRQTYRGHDRVVIVTDMQTFGGFHYGDVSSQVPANIPIYAFNMQGYAPAMMETGTTRHELGGLTDHTFKTIPMVEAGLAAGWPWELQS